MEPQCRLTDKNSIIRIKGQLRFGSLNGQIMTIGRLSDDQFCDKSAQTSCLGSLRHLCPTHGTSFRLSHVVVITLWAIHREWPCLRESKEVTRNLIVDQEYLNVEGAAWDTLERKRVRFFK